MIRINLLPHRIAKRRQRRRQFYALAGSMVLLGALIGFGVHVVYTAHIEDQEARNAFLKEEIVRLDREIAEIRRLREQIDAMLARKQVIESLQGARAETVHLFNELAQRLPDGVYLKSVKQTGRQVRVVGLAQSNARVSHFMRNVEASAFLEQPRLIEAKAVTQDNRRLSEFSLDIAIRPPVQAEPAGGAGVAKTAAKGAQK
ncbi:PilN domain-containing protein [Thauera aminoaromatica]|uniref:Fimbrial assembly family protein n=1 Tax=Thauera aminoaromatica TaxID=164330 RepID=C4ZLJ2_THASP|nr:PilN domain-containing protein [Thauera aminoaromatica]ACK53604.1 Fimbrial assembly family protein [Thauera aminoaromatica]